MAATKKSKAAGNKSDAGKAKRAVALRQYGYGGQQLDLGQVFDLRGLMHDATLLRLNHARVFAADKPTVDCQHCGAHFESSQFRDGHVRRRHELRPSARMVMAPRQPGESELDFDQRRVAFEAAVNSQIVNEENEDEKGAAPIDWANTTASREESLTK